MSNPSKTKGTQAETAVVGYLKQRGWPYAERRALAGALDRGDIAGVVGVTLEVKNCKAIDLAGWLKEALTEQANNGDHVGAVVAKRRGTTNPADWYALMTFRQLCDLLAAAGYRGQGEPIEPLPQASSASEAAVEDVQDLRLSGQADHEGPVR